MTVRALYRSLDQELVAILRGGRYWDELSMSILEDEWWARHGTVGRG